MPVIFPEEIDLKVVFVGLANSGKTTLVRRLKDPDNFDSNVSPTMGVAIELLEFNDKSGRTVQYLALDCGGQPAFFQMWEGHVRASDGVVFLFDSTDPSSVEDTSLWLSEVLNWLEQGKYEGDTPLLFLANKSDDKKALPLDDIVKRLNLNKFIGKSFGVYHISALKGDNVTEAFQWFLNRVKSDITPE